MEGSEVTEYCVCALLNSGRLKVTNTGNVFLHVYSGLRVDRICKLVASSERAALIASLSLLNTTGRYQRLSSTWGKPRSRDPAADRTPTRGAETPGLPAFIRPPLPPFMWNGSLPADKSIGFALWTPTCDNKRLYRQPAAWNNGAALQLKAKYTPVMAEE